MFQHRPGRTAETAGAVVEPPRRSEQRRQSESVRDTERKRRQRNEQKEVIIPKCADRKRREELELCDEDWLRWYFHELFWYEWTRQQKTMISMIRNAILYGGDQGMAASRGEGKTKICERSLLKYTFQGIIDLSVLFAATATLSQDSLQAMRFEIERNKRLCADYPEVCVPVIALGDTPNRAHYQLVTGFRHDNGEPYTMESSKFTWCGNEIYLPNVPGSPAALGIIVTRGLDSAVRGINKLNRRPKVAVIDDPDTLDTVNSEDQAHKLEENIETGIAGLGDQQNTVARVILTTIQRRNCVSAWYTDPKIKSSFKGRRFRFLIKKPERMDMWEEYVQRWQDDKRRVNEGGDCLDEFSRGAHNFFLENREVMEAGAEVANPNRYSRKTLPDGSQLEVSALQHYFNAVARTSPEAVAAEYDNDPAEETGPVESGINPTRIQRQLSRFDRRIIPPGCTVLVRASDVRKSALHWLVRAFKPDGTCYVIDYDVWEVHGTKYGEDQGVDLAIKRSVLAFLEEAKKAEYVAADTGEVKPVDITLIDARWQTEAIVAACEEAGIGVYPIMGFGRSARTKGPNFSPAQKRTERVKPGDGWKMVKRGKTWLVEADTDRFKRYEHDRWMTTRGEPGCAYLYGTPSDPGHRMNDDERRHHAYAHHICNESEIEEPYRGGLRRRWKEKSENTHWLDASYYTNVGANIKGIRPLKKPAVAPTADTKPTAAQRKKVRYL